MKTVAQTSLLLALFAHTLACVFVVVSRVTFPGQIEWMTGSVLDHVERVRQGLPLYTEPTASWIPYIYPPLFSWIGAALGGSAVACRLVSVMSAIVQAVLVGRIALRLSASRFWSVVAVGLFFACFPYCGWWYDLERSDTLCGAMMLAVCWLLLDPRSFAASVIAGAMTGLAFFAKQQAVFYGAGAFAALVVASRLEPRPRLRNVVGFGLSAAFVLGGLLFLCVRSSNGWFAYYIFNVPRAHGILWPLVGEIVQRDIAEGFLLVAATFGFVALAAQSALRRTVERATVVFASMLAAGFIAAFSSRLHVGGWINVLQPWTSFASIAIAVLAARMAEKYGLKAVLASSAFVLGQVLLWRYDPRAFIPRPGMRSATERFHARIRDLETKGEVLLVSQGHVTRERHFQMSALADVVRVEGHSPPDLVDGLRDRRFVAVVDDARGPRDQRLPLWPPVMLEDIDDLEAPLFASYFVAERLDDELVALPMVAPAMPRWVMLPRTRALEGLSHEDAKLRHQNEMRLADERACKLRDGGTPSFAAKEIEFLAAPAPGSTAP